ncbi:MAG TPA: flavodoxin domain-containing protein [Bacteriovoracaceae bacterium]|nr:flavodoxin domain-containing protein [Bacteriovoracaceae bacterium]
MLTILYGSQGGNAKNLAHVISESLSDQSIDFEVSDMGELEPEVMLGLKQVLIVTSTYGDGEAPDNASEWLSYLKFTDDIKLHHLSYAVIGLGDTYYPHFCQCGKDFDHYLSKRGAHALVQRLDCDLYYEEQYQEWLTGFIQVLKKNIQA